MGLTREQILAAADLKQVRVEVPEWGGSIHVRMLSFAERAAFEEWMAAHKGADEKVRSADLLARLVVLCAVDDDGARLFADGDEGAVQAKGSAAVMRVFEAAAKLNRITKEDQEELVKN